MEPHRGGGSSSVSEAGSTHPYVFVQMPSLNRERERDSVCMLIPQYHTLRIRMSASVDFVRYCTRGHFIPGSSFSYIVLPCLGFPSFCSKGSFSLVSPRLAGLSPPPPPSPHGLKGIPLAPSPSRLVGGVTHPAGPDEKGVQYSLAFNLSLFPPNPLVCPHFGEWPQVPMNPWGRNLTHVSFRRSLYLKISGCNSSQTGTLDTF